MVKKRTTGYLLQDLGLVVLLVGIAAAAIVTGMAEDTLRAEFTVMLLLMFLPIMLAGFKLVSLSVVIAALEVVAYTGYKLFRSLAFGEEISIFCYCWIFLPLLSVCAMSAFVVGNRQTEMENEMLREQVEELTMINALTGLNNLRSMYIDLKRQVAYAQRNNISLSLMIVKLRYAPELKKVLSRRQYESVLQKVAKLVTDAVRVEDRTYSLDNDGTVGIILTCTQKDSDMVRRRIRSFVEQKEAFKDIIGNALKVELRIACLQYDQDVYDGDMVMFKQRVENELQYDV